MEWGGEVARDQNIPEANSWKKGVQLNFCKSLPWGWLEFLLMNDLLWKTDKGPSVLFSSYSFLNVSFSTKFLACANCVFGTFFWAYPGSVFEMLLLTECPNELMI